MIDLATTARRYLHVDEFVLICHVPRRTVYRWIKRTQLPAVRVHGSLHIPIDAARRFVQQPRVHSVPRVG
jgi:hypothetical protein